jgi:hypothetical protein
MLPVHAEQGNTSHNANQPKAAPQQTTTPTAPPIVAPTKPADNATQSNTNREYPVSVSKIPDVTVRRDLTDCLMVFFTAVLAIAGAVGTYYAVKTLRVLRHEAKIAAAALKQTARFARAASKTADAAAMNAQAVINAERPWILIEHEWRKIEDLEGLVFYAVNKGATPAEIVEAHFEREIMPYIPDKLPLPPLYKSTVLIPRRGDNLIVKNETWDLNEVPIHPESWINNMMKRDTIANATDFVYFYGVIVYRDMLYKSTDKSGLHYTRFCFVYDVFLKALFPSGPQEYREKT